MLASPSLARLRSQGVAATLHERIVQRHTVAAPLFLRDIMGCTRAFLCVLLPPLAVLDKGCGTVVMVAVLTLFGWVPGALAALIICNTAGKSE